LYLFCWPLHVDGTELWSYTWRDVTSPSNRNMKRSPTISGIKLK
jgi:hypothetical protein